MLGVFAILLSLLGLAVFLLVDNLPAIVERRMLAEAKTRGFGLRMETVQPEGLLPWDDRPPRVVAKGVTLSADAVPEVDIAIEELVVSLEGFEPKSLSGSNVRVNARNIPALLALEREVLERGGKDLPLHAAPLRLRVGSLAEALPISAIGTLAAVDKSQGGVLELSDLRIELLVPLIDTQLGPIAVELERTGGMLWLRPRDTSFVRVGISETADRGRVELSGGTPELVRKLLPIDLPGKKVSGELELFLAGDKARKGSFAIELEDYVPPHPRELDGLLFGSKTRIAGQLEIGLLDVKLKELLLQAGGFKLKGDGTVGFGGVVAVELNGHAGCKDLAHSALAAHVGAVAARFARQVAGDRLSGTVEVHISVRGNLRNVAAVSISPAAVVRCKVEL